MLSFGFTQISLAVRLKPLAARNLSVELTFHENLSFLYWPILAEEKCRGYFRAIAERETWNARLCSTLQSTPPREVAIWSKSNQRYCCGRTLDQEGSPYSDPQKLVSCDLS